MSIPYLRITMSNFLTMLSSIQQRKWLIVQCTTSQVPYNHNCPVISAPLLWMSVSLHVYSIALFLNFVLKNKKLKVLSHWYMRWRRWIGGRDTYMYGWITPAKKTELCTCTVAIAHVHLHVNWYLLIYNKPGLSLEGDLGKNVYIQVNPPRSTGSLPEIVPDSRTPRSETESTGCEKKYIFFF